MNRLLKIFYTLSAIVLMCSFVYISNKRVTVVNFDQLQKQGEKRSDDTLYVMNFWATWCKPCVQEIPYFQQASTKFDDQKVKVVFVSLNSVKELDKVENYVVSKNLNEDVFLLNPSGTADWINKVDPEWSGAIPATAMYKNGKKVYFKEGGFSQQELNERIDEKKEQ